jgi:hypothetical protein
MIGAKRVIATMASGLLVLIIIAFSAAAASAATTCPSAAGAQSVTFAFTGAEQTCVIPAGVSSASVTAVGAPGGDSYGSVGGSGAVTTGTLTVTGAETLYVEVGGAGGDGEAVAGTPGFNGGGSGGSFGGGGGGASDVRTDPASTLLATTDSRLIVAGGGGGGGADGSGPTGLVASGNGGAAGTAGGDGAGVADVGGGFGGGPGESSPTANGGAGGTAGSAGEQAGKPGGAGGLGTGGDGGSGLGGAGGGGLYGGGGGGGKASVNDDEDDESGSGGGGGGSSLAPAGGSVTANSSGLPSEVVISYTVPAPAACSGDSATTAYQTAKTVSFSCTGTGLSYSLVSGPSHGTLGPISGNQVTYTPNAGFSGPDSFQVRATNVVGQTATDTVTVTVAAAPGAPTATITTPANGATYTQGQVIDASYTCAESGNGPGLKPGTAGCSGTVPNGAAINTSTVGPQTFSVTATSTDGQSTTQTSGYTVAAAAKLADLKASITGPSHAADGATFSETIKVTNAGPAAATSAVTGLVIPNGLTATNLGGGGKLGPAIYWTAPSIAAGQTVTYTVTFKVAGNARGNVLIAVATASTQIKDSNYANNAAATTVTLGSGTTKIGAFARAKRNLFASGKQIITRLEHRTLGSKHAPHHHR